MISTLFSDSTFIIVSLMALVFTIVAISQKLKDDSVVEVTKINDKKVGESDDEKKESENSN